MFNKPPPEYPLLMHVNMVAYQQQICLAQVKVPDINVTKELIKIESDFERK